MASKKGRAVRPDPWETGKLGNDERYVRRASAADALQHWLRSRSALAWTVRFTTAAERQLSKLDRPVQRRFLNVTDEISQSNPRGRGKAMRDRLVSTRLLQHGLLILRPPSCSNRSVEQS